MKRPPTALVLRIIAVTTALGAAAASCDLNTPERGDSTTTADSNTTIADSSTSTKDSSTTSPDGTTRTRAKVASHGTAIIHGSWTFDFDAGKEDVDEVDADVFWEGETETSRRLRPLSPSEVGVAAPTSKLANLGIRDFDGVSLADLRDAPYSSQPIKGGDVEDQMPVGTVIAVHTTKGNFAKVRVDGRDVAGTRPDTYHNMAVRWVTFED